MRETSKPSIQRESEAEDDEKGHLGREHRLIVEEEDEEIVNRDEKKKKEK